MAGQRQPTKLVIAKGAKHLTKAEVEERLSREVPPLDDEIIAPEFLSKKQTDEFYKIAGQLKKLDIMGATDVDALARYIVANDFYIHSVKQLRKPEVKNDPIAFGAWAKTNETYFKQCRAAANDLGLSITSRCKIVVPVPKTETPKENKFKKFEKGAVASG